MSECPSCGATLKSKICACGYAVKPTAPKPKPFRSETSAVLRQKMAEKQREVDAFVAKYRAENPGSTKREACMALLPRLRQVEQDFKAYRDFDEAMNEYRAEFESESA